MTGLLHLAATIDAHPQAVRAVATAVVLLTFTFVAGDLVLGTLKSRQRRNGKRFHRNVVVPFKRAARQRRQA